VADRLCSMEQSLKSLEDSLKHSVGDMTAKLDRLLGRDHSIRAGTHPPTADEPADHETHRRLDGLDRTLNMIADAVGVRVRAKQEEDAEDRKRLKERLKEALALEKDDRLNGGREGEGEDWLEFLFGICRPDGRVGKMGSRCAQCTPCRRLARAR
jgi:hypothetical protein